ADERDVQLDLAGQAGPHLDVPGQDLAVGGHQEHIVERQTLAQVVVEHEAPRVRAAELSTASPAAPPAEDDESSPGSAARQGDHCRHARSDDTLGWGLASPRPCPTPALPLLDRPIRGSA